MDLFSALPAGLLPVLDTSVLGRHLLAADQAETIRALLGIASADLPDDSTTDIGPYVQRAYDSGAAGLQLVSGRTYLWNSPVFLDRNDVLGGFVIEGNRATIVLGPDLPTSDWSRDRTTRFAVFPNTRRTALIGGSVAVTPGNRATGTKVGAVRPLTIRNVVLDGQRRNAGFSYANRSAVTFDQVVLYRARVGATWADYSDGNAFLNCYSRGGGGPAAQVLVEQVAAGDGLVVMGGKADVTVDLLHLRGCRGGVIQGVVTGRMTFEECDGIVVSGAHLEGQESNRPMVTVRNSRVTMQGCALYQTYDPSVGTVVVDDTSSSATNSDVTFSECTVMQLVAPAHPDAHFAPFLILGTLRAGTRITARGLQGRLAAMADSPGRWRDAVQPAVQAKSAKPLQKVLASSTALAVIAAGDFLIRKTVSKWEVLPADGGPVMSRKQSAGPSIQSVKAISGSNATGRLARSTRYTYTAAVRDARGHYSKRSPIRGAVVGSGQMLLLQIALADAPGTLVVWRATGNDPAGHPDRYAVFPTRASVAQLFDTGDRIGGQPWITRGVPMPKTVAAKNGTANAMLVDGAVIAS